MAEQPDRNGALTKEKLRLRYTSAGPTPPGCGLRSVGAFPHVSGYAYRFGVRQRVEIDLSQWVGGRRRIIDGSIWLDCRRAFVAENSQTGRRVALSEARERLRRGTNPIVINRLVCLQLWTK